MSFPQLRSRTINQLTSGTAAVAYVLAAAAGSFTVSGTDASLKAGYILAADAGSHAVTGTAANLNKGFTLTAEPGSVTWTGSPAALPVTMPAESGSFAWTGSDATLSHFSSEAHLSVNHNWQRGYPRAFAPAVFGKRKFNFVNAYSLGAEPGSFTVVGTEASFTTTQVGVNVNQRDRVRRTWPRHFAPSPWGHLTGVRSVNRIGYATTSYALSAEPGSYAITGTAATLLHGHRLDASAGAVSWNVTAANLNKGFTLQAASGSFVITAPEIQFAIVMPAAGGSFVWTGSDATLIYSGAPPPISDYLVNQYWWMKNMPNFYNEYETITKSDTVDFPRGLCDAIYVGGAGIVQVVGQDGDVVPFTAIAGQILPVKAKRVNDTSTTATLMVALYQR